MRQLERRVDEFGRELWEGEEVRPVVGFEEIYSVSNYGSLWKYEAKTKKCIPIRQYREKRRYIRIALSNNGKQLWRNVHVLVAQAFIPNPLDKAFVNHIDGDKLNSRVDNLEWVTELENHQHACDMGLNKHYKLSAKQKHEICEAYYGGHATVKQLSERYGIVQSGIRRHIKNYEKLKRELPIKDAA
jgi:DNA-binding MarR family transcriptional regulator